MTLEPTMSLTGPAQWIPLATQPETVGQTMRVPLPADDVHRFFRLAY